jgi:hypothetical protein
MSPWSGSGGRVRRSRRLALETVVENEKGRVRRYRRPNHKCPAKEFLDGCQKNMRKRFDGSFSALTMMGPSYHNPQRFKPLQGKGKPLWEFKEHDHRLYCSREVVGDWVEVVLLSGWVKDKAGKSSEENAQIEKALNLLNELNQGGK